MWYTDDVLELVLKRIQLLFEFQNVGLFAKLDRFDKSVLEELLLEKAFRLELRNVIANYD